jgi:hypothetical protein
VSALLSLSFQGPDLGRWAALRERCGLDGKDLFEIIYADIIGHGGTHAHRCAGSRAKCRDFKIRSRCDWISTYRDTSFCPLRVVPHQRTFQDHAPGLLWLPQWHDGTWRCIRFFSS